MIFGLTERNQLLKDIHRRVISMALDYSRLNAALERNETVTDGIKTLLAAVVAELRDIKASNNLAEVQARIDAIATQLEANNAEIADATIAGTDAEMELPVFEEPVIDVIPVVEEPVVEMVVEPVIEA
jgi:vacuolar-type H+-ATPase subunit E/Vma4